MGEPPQQTGLHHPTTSELMSNVEICLWRRQRCIFLILFSPAGPAGPLDPGAPDGPLVPASPRGPVGPGSPRDPEEAEEVTRLISFADDVLASSELRPWAHSDIIWHHCAQGQQRVIISTQKISVCPLPTMEDEVLISQSSVLPLTTVCPVGLQWSPLKGCILKKQQSSFTVFARKPISPLFTLRTCGDNRNI